MPGDGFRPDSYRRAIARACDLHGIARWSPNQLRHAMGTRVRSVAGLDTVSTVLGHSSPDTSLIYAEKDLDRARKVIAEIG